MYPFKLPYMLRIVGPKLRMDRVLRELLGPVKSPRRVSYLD